MLLGVCSVLNLCHVMCFQTPIMILINETRLQPSAGTPITGKDVVICKYPSDPSVALGYLSTAFLLASIVAGYLSLFYPYKGKAVPQSVLFRSTAFVVFFNIAL